VAVGPAAAVGLRCSGRSRGPGGLPAARTEERRLWHLPVEPDALQHAAHIHQHLQPHVQQWIHALRHDLQVLRWDPDQLGETNLPQQQREPAAARAVQEGHHDARAIHTGVRARKQRLHNI